MFSRKTLLFATALSLLTSGAKADTPSCVSVDCAALGYTQTAAQCSGADTILKCPFDTSLVACPTTVSTPILSIAQKFLLSLCHTEPLYTLGTSISSCAVAHFGTGPFCSYISYDGSPYISEIKSLKIEKNTCANYFSDNPSAYSSMKTTQDFVSLLENILLYDPCTNEVTVNAYEICTKYCPTDETKCIAKRSMTCDEAIASKGTLLLTTPTDLSVFNGNTTFYLKYNVTISSDIDSIGSSGFYAADSLTPCKNNVPPRPKLKFSGNIKKSTDAYFAVDTTINQLTVKQNTRITTNKVLDIRQVYFTSPSYTLSVGGDLSSTINLGLNCFNGAYGNTCKTYINTGGYGSGYTAWCGSATANNVSYNYASSCTDTTKPSSGGCYQKSTTYTDCVPIE